ncbi:hypothetical protein [Dyadobacter fermentans]|uniref:General stress protein 17M-like domain-containing protein n=1 Tax=Dyadobacter fermentans (strain ATCC 700827 / DSM 18053 / CIP 107007 / KCTC 52180 / NS114) TaxID=471854 RepID=C6VZL8_DYAFD|nr:hypothetical protein [Dyadobacter fermentans]ACT93496.1 hypothetical protein Dfer_2274 [Dyadobacter fermentans DSM 18053]
MSKTVVGIFEYESDAQNAQNYLLANGFGDGDVDIKTASYKPEVNDTEDGLLDKIGHFFRELFNGDNDDETERYIEAGKRGTIVTVHALSADEAVAAAHIMDEYGALDVTDSKHAPQPGAQYEDAIVNPPSTAESDQPVPDSVPARGLHLRSRIIDRTLPQEHRLRQRAADGPPGSDPGQQTTELHKTIAERDALINEIVSNEPNNKA